MARGGLDTMQRITHTEGSTSFLETRMSWDKNTHKQSSPTQSTHKNILSNILRNIFSNILSSGGREFRAASARS